MKTVRRVCEVLTSTVVISVATVTLFWTFAVVQNLHPPIEPGKLAVAYFYGILMGLLTMGIYIFPSAFVVSLVVTSLKRWSWTGTLTLLLVVALCSSVCAYLIDPTQSASKTGPGDYLTRFEWFTSRFNLIGIITGFGASLISFSAMYCCRRRRLKAGN